MTQLKLLAELAPLILPILGGAVTYTAMFIWWVFKQGMRISDLEKEKEQTNKRFTDLKTEIAVIIAKHEALDSKVVKELSHIREAIARMEALLEYTLAKPGN